MSVRTCQDYQDIQPIILLSIRQILVQAPSSTFLLWGYSRNQPTKAGRNSPQRSFLTIFLSLHSQNVQKPAPQRAISAVAYKKFAYIFSFDWFRYAKKRNFFVKNLFLFSSKAGLATTATYSQNCPCVVLIVFSSSS